MTADSNAASSCVPAESRLRVQIREIMAQHLDLRRYRIFLFGSARFGASSRGSDIDIGILGEEALPGRVLEKIRAELDTLRTLRPFDLVDFNGVDPAFRSVALEHAEEL
jgi:predicted nucleotidyltransferase